MREPLADGFAEILEPLIRRLVYEEVQRQKLEWRWLTPEQAGELLGISAAAVRQRAARGQLVAKRLEGRLYFDIRDLDAAIRNGRYHACPHDIDKWAERCANTPGPDDQGGKP